MCGVYLCIFVYICVFVRLQPSSFYILVLQSMCQGALTEPDWDDDIMEDVQERLHANIYQQDQLKTTLKVKDIHHASSNEKTKESESTAAPQAASGTMSRSSSDQDLSKLGSSSSSPGSNDDNYNEFPENNILPLGSNQMLKASNLYTEIATTRPRSNSNASDKGSDKGGEGSVSGDIEMGKLTSTLFYAIYYFFN